MQKRDEAHWQAVVGNFCRHAAKHILKGATFAELRARLTPLIDGILDCIGIPAEARTPGLREAMATMLGMDVWNVTPIPENRFRPRKLNKPERNAPCPCGSGHKFKQCCANLPPLDLGITEELMLSEVLGLLPQKTLKELPLHDLHPDALALVAQRWLDEGDAKKAISLLERYFTNLDKLDSRAEWAADTLLNAYLETNAPRKKQKFVDALKAATNKDLRSCGWQRQATIDSDQGNYIGAWDAFREAQRHAPNAPALSHLEVLLLLSEGRDVEAKARADFWIARLQRDAKYDHSELITVLRNMVGSDAGKLQTLHFARGPLGRLADAVANWPAPACSYRLIGGCELEPKVELARLEGRWMDLRQSADLDDMIAFAAQFPLAGQSFMVLRDLSEIALMLDPGVPGSREALSRQILQRGEALRQAVLSKLKAQNRELPWGFLNNRPMLTLVQYFIEAMEKTSPGECLALMRWSVTVANPTDNSGLRGPLIHKLIELGKPREAIDIAAAYPDDFAEIEYGRVLALFVDQQAEAAQACLRKAVERWPKAWKMLHAANPKQARSKNPGYITVGGDDEAWHYRIDHRDLWQSTGALRWGAAVRISQPATKAAARTKPAKPGAASLPEAPEPDNQGQLF
ncbi:MAG: SEC-C domain-containing protein [Azonexus sp.]|jgi:tetratricopeptide (TPR) repeat protein|nr:SEC-C domain-containing protein [Azonexus sp.]